MQETESEAPINKPKRIRKPHQHRDPCSRCGALQLHSSGMCKACRTSERIKPLRVDNRPINDKTLHRRRLKQEWGMMK